MKVLMVSDSIVGNGIGITVFRLYESLVSRGVHCDIVCYQDLNQISEIKEKIEGDNNHLFSIPSISKGPIRYIRNIRKICRDNNYDVIHIHTSLMIFLAAYAAKKEGVSVRIGHAHGAKFFNYPESIVRVLEVVGKYLNRKFCTRFVTCSQVSALYTFGVEGTFIPNYLPTSEILDVDISKVRLLKKDIVKDDAIIFGYMGSLDGKKNVIFLPDVIYSLVEHGINARLVIAGEGTMRHTILEKAANLGISDRILLLGHRDDCNQLVQMFDYFISASLTEGMSLSMIEAQMAGKPCIVSDLIPDYSDLRVGLFRKISGFDSAQWASSIEKWMQDGFCSISRDEAIRSITENGFTEEVIIDRLMKVYQG